MAKDSVEGQLNSNGNKRGMSPNSRKNLKQNGKKQGRPRIKIDFQLVERLAHIHCTQEEIAFTLNVSVDTLQRNEEFCGIYKKAIEGGKASLRRMQWDSAEGVEPKLLLDKQGKHYLDSKGQAVLYGGRLPNITMQIWLGKQYLNQKDTQQIETPLGRPFEVSVIEKVKDYGNGN